LFTGIVEELGEISGRQQFRDSIVLIIKGEKVMSGLKEGDSVAVNGVCLTVAKIFPAAFYADVMPETLRKTNLHELKNGEKVNLERALPVGGRFGGHFVSGHIDGTGKILAEKKEGNALLKKISAPAGVMSYIIPKGSIAIDGISLTVVEAEEDSFSVSLIPHTAKFTTLGYKKPGDKVNLEADLLGKYVQKFCLNFFKGDQGNNLSVEQGSTLWPDDPEKEGITYNLLKKKGFL
jgi:riboflavin synthase